MEKWLVFRKFAKWFRLIEICFALLLLSWLYSKLPLVAKASSIFFGHLISAATSPIFTFTLFNSILIFLFIKSGAVAENRSVSGDNAEADLIVYFAPETFSPDMEEIVYQDKEMINDVASESKEELMRKNSEESMEELMRENYREEESEKSSEVPAEEELMSSEEFKRTVEDFIAKQMKFHKEEKMAIVACS